MQPIDKKRKNGTFKEYFKAFLLIGLFCLYTCFSDLYLFLPPMIGLLFVIYVQISRENLWILTLALFACLIFFEYDHNKHAGILPILFVLVNWLVVKKFRMLFDENAFFIILYVAMIYFAYFFVLYLFGGLAGGLSTFGLVAAFVSYVFYESLLGMVYEKIKYQI